MLVGNAQVTFRPPAFAQVLLEQGKVTREVLNEALRMRAKENRYLGQILCEIGRLNAADVEGALASPAAGVVRAGASSRAELAVRHRGSSRKERTAMTPGSPDRPPPPAAAGSKEPASIPARPFAHTARRPDLSAPFAATLMTGLMSAGLFLGGVFQHGVPLERVLPRLFVDPFGAMALALIAAAGVMARIGDI